MMLHAYEVSLIDVVVPQAQTVKIQRLSLKLVFQFSSVQFIFAEKRLADFSWLITKRNIKSAKRKFFDSWKEREVTTQIFSGCWGWCWSTLQKSFLNFHEVLLFSWMNVHRQRTSNSCAASWLYGTTIKAKKSKHQRKTC